MLHPVVDHWKVGKINYHKNIEDAVDWGRFRDEMTDLLTFLGLILSEKSLAEW
ncbi:MAG: hypothetical protein R2861_10410 [Desulfobacterales bacterium]